MTLYSIKSIIYNGMLHTSFVIPPHYLSLNEKRHLIKQLALFYNHLPNHLRNEPIRDPLDSTGQMAAV